MSEFNYVTAALLGALQGLTEFLPISSSAHLAVGQRLLGLPPDSGAMLLFDVLTHLGTLVAVLLVFARPARLFIHRLVRETNGSAGGAHYAQRIAWLTIVASVPTAVIGLSFQSVFEKAFNRPRWIGAGLLLTGTILALTALPHRQKRGWKTFSPWRAWLVGTAQGLAILPGLSRSGWTICMASLCGMRRRWSAQFSFLMAVPAIVAAATIKLKDTLELPAAQLTALPWGPVVMGTLVSMVVGVVALYLLLGVVRRARLHYFSVYCWVLGGWLLAGFPPFR